MTTHPSPVRRPLHPAWGISIFVLIALIGLFYIKWSPYYDRAFAAAEMHSIGQSILTGTDGILPTSSLQAALDYAVVYGRAIWKALLLGLLLGSAMQALLPTPWIKRWLGGLGAGSVLTGSLLSVPSMMCTCCAAPVVTGLRQCRAAPGSTAAFWLGNTMLNPATLVFMGFVLGATRAWLLPVLDLSIDNSLLWIIGAAIIGMLFVIPTAGEVPIVQALLSLGVAAGPAAALLMTLPPISLPSLAMVAKSFRRAELAVLIFGVVAFGVLGAGVVILMGF